MPLDATQRFLGLERRWTLRCPTRSGRHFFQVRKSQSPAVVFDVSTAFCCTEAARHWSAASAWTSKPIPRGTSHRAVPLKETCPPSSAGVDPFPKTAQMSLVSPLSSKRSFRGRPGTSTATDHHLLSDGCRFRSLLPQKQHPSKWSAERTWKCRPGSARFPAEGREGYRRPAPPVPTLLAAAGSSGSAPCTSHPVWPGRANVSRFLHQSSKKSYINKWSFLAFLTKSNSTAQGLWLTHQHEPDGRML